MQKNGRLPFGRAIFECRFLYLLFFILMLIAVQPLDETIGKFGILLDLITTAILVSSIVAISQKKNHTVLGVLLAVPMLVSVWALHFYKITWLEILGTTLGIVFFVFVIAMILSFIFIQDEVTGDLIAGAAVVYLLMAIIWTYVYRLIEMIHPGSFTIAESQSLLTSSPFLYYSFVTMSTLGYGDIFPVSTAAKSCAILEALIGQLYLVIMVAWLVGVHISQSMEKKS
jgi:hypothetical protein